MEVRKKKEEATLIVEIAGRLDTTSYTVFEKEIEELVASDEKNIIIDLKEVDYVSSSGLRGLLIGLKKFKGAGRGFVLCGLTENVKEVFDIAGFSAIFTIYKDSREALEKLNSTKE